MPPASRRAALARAVVATLGAADRLRRRFEHLLAPHGLTFQQYNVLRILRGAGDEGLPTMAIRDRMIEQAPGITALLDRLQRKRLVERSPAKADRREVRCRLTRTGLALLARVDAAMDEADRAAFERLGPRQLGALTRLLEDVARN